jgi:uncharacterized damage-inducible protein DinB
MAGAVPPPAFYTLTRMTNMRSETRQVPRPAAGEFAPFYAGYVAAVPEGDVLEILEVQGRRVAELLATLTEERAGFRYAEGKWSVREVIGHLTDAERIFAYRALRFARGDRTPLATFDEDAYVVESGADARPVAELAAEHAAMRAATLALLRGLPAEALERGGEASGARVTVRALTYIIAGHEAHHLGVLRERYGLDG